KWKSKEIRTKELHLKIIHALVTIVQYILAAILATVILEIVVTSHYQNATLTVATGISMILNVSLMGFSAHRFFSWYKSIGSSLVLLLFGLSFLTFALTSGVAVFMDTYHLLAKQSEISPHSQVVFPSFDPGTVMYVPHEIYHYADLVSFVLVWAGTALLLRHYSKRIGNLKFWIIIGLPLVYYLSTLIEFFNLYTPSTDSQYFYFYLYLSMNSTAGGILFGVAFRTVARTIPQTSVVRDYMTLAAFGLVLLFISDQVTLTNSGYPPFGLATISVMGLSAYLILVGIYSSAVSIAQDTKLRQSMRKSTIAESKFLDSIGSAEMEHEIENKVLLIAKKHSSEMVEESGIQASLTDDEMRRYLQQVLEEIKKEPK
ncbi:MAG: hypothetical protein M3044_21970, partial [Thermoproteota archaeon]|nr:hypothetical protein [Thermoproteota archaeon]